MRPVELREANAFVRAHHRHHQPVRRARFQLAAWQAEVLVGVAICGRPVARAYDPLRVLEVTRLCTDGTKNACSLLYAAAARVAREMGFERVQTYVLAEESGVSLRAAGWALVGETAGGAWHHAEEPQLRLDGGTRRQDQPAGPKRRWAKILA